MSQTSGRCFALAGLSDVGALCRMDRGATALVLTLAMALPGVARAQTPVAPQSLQALDLRCQVVSEDLRVGSLSLAVTGGRAFQLPANEGGVRQTPRLTRQTLAILEDTLGLLDGSIVEVGRFRENTGRASVLYSDGAPWTLVLADAKAAGDGLETATIDLVQSRPPEEGRTRSKFVGFCQATARSQAPLTEAEISAMLSGPGDRRADVLRNTLDATPPPAPSANPRTDRTRPPPTEPTPESVTLPLQNFRCAILSDEAAAGELQFSMSGGRGYLEPDRRGRTKVTTTPRKMTIDRDSLGLFADKYPLGDLGNRAGLFDLFQDSDGANWSLGVDNLLSGEQANNRENRDRVEIARVSFEPSRVRMAEEIQPRVVKRYIGLCRQSSTEQSALSSDERRAELWR
jgi:hypothetical protein